MSKYGWLGLMAVVLVLTTQASAVEQNVRLSRRLLQSTADLEEELFTAVEAGDVKKTRALIAKGVDIESTNEDGDRPIEVAAQEGDLKMVKFLLKKGADPEGDGLSSSPLHYAAAYGFEAVARELLVAGANPNTSVWFMTPLYGAAQRGHVGVVEVLIEFGAGVDIPCSLGATPLYAATFYGEIEVLKALVEGGADVDFPQDQGFTPIFVAPNVEIAEFLIESGADVNVRSVTDESAWEGKSPDLRGATPLIYAVLRNKPWFVSLLLENGADPDLKSGAGSTALEMARDRGYDDIVDILESV